MSLVKLVPPLGAVQYIDATGAVHLADANGIFTVDSAVVDITIMLAAGFVLLVDQSAATAGRPTTGLYTGLMFFDTTLNKPIWRNAANTGWVDATGAAA